MGEGGQQSAETPLRNEAPRGGFSFGDPRDPGYLDIPDPVPFRGSIGALRNRFPGISITAPSSFPVGPDIPSVDEETQSVPSPQEDTEDGEDLVTGEGIGTTEF